MAPPGSDNVTATEAGGRAAWRVRLGDFVARAWFQRVIITLIAINAVTLGLETSPTAMAVAGPVLIAVDRVILFVFVVEVVMRMTAHGWRFFRDPWSVFDFLVVGVALVPATEGFSVLRALRILRVLRLISVVPSMRIVVQALLAAVPGLGSIAALLLLIFYVAGVMATKLFGAGFPDWFGSVPASVYSLFQIMTLESWSMGIVRPVMEVYPYAWAFFVPFILVATFTMLNLFIAVVVSAMQSEHEAELKEASAAIEEAAHADAEAVQRQLAELRQEVRDLRGLLTARLPAK